jgi:hypothetical protein
MEAVQNLEVLNYREADICPDLKPSGEPLTRDSALVTGSHKARHIMTVPIDPIDLDIVLPWPEEAGRPFLIAIPSAGAGCDMTIRCRRDIRASSRGAGDHGRCGLEG